MLSWPYTSDLFCLPMPSHVTCHQLPGLSTSVTSIATACVLCVCWQDWVETLKQCSLVFHNPAVHIWSSLRLSWELLGHLEVWKDMAEAIRDSGFLGLPRNEQRRTPVWLVIFKSPRHRLLSEFTLGCYVIWLSQKDLLSGRFPADNCADIWYLFWSTRQLGHFDPHASNSVAIDFL